MTIIHGAARPMMRVVEYGPWAPEACNGYVHEKLRRVIVSAHEEYSDRFILSFLPTYVKENDHYQLSLIATDRRTGARYDLRKALFFRQWNWNFRYFWFLNANDHRPVSIVNIYSLFEGYETMWNRDVHLRLIKLKMEAGMEIEVPKNKQGWVPMVLEASDDFGPGPCEFRGLEVVWYFDHEPAARGRGGSSFDSMGYYWPPG